MTRAMLDKESYLLWIVYKLERIADQCTNICQRTTFLTEGDIQMYPASV